MQPKKKEPRNATRLSLPKKKSSLYTHTKAAAIFDFDYKKKYTKNGCILDLTRFSSLLRHTAAVIVTKGQNEVCRNVAKGV